MHGETTFLKEKAEYFWGPSPIITNRIVRQIAQECDDLAKIQDLQVMTTLKPCYHADVYSVITTCVGTFENISLSAF